MGHRGENAREPALEVFFLGLLYYLPAALRRFVVDGRKAANTTLQQGRSPFAASINAWAGSSVDWQVQQHGAASSEKKIIWACNLKLCPVPSSSYMTSHQP